MPLVTQDKVRKKEPSPHYKTTHGNQGRTNEEARKMSQDQNGFESGTVPPAAQYDAPLEKEVQNKNIKDERNIRDRNTRSAQETKSDESDSSTDNIERHLDDTNIALSDDAALYLKYPELSDILNGFSATVQLMKNNVDIHSVEKVYQELEAQVLVPYKSSWRREHRRLLAYHMAKIGFAKALVTYYKYVMYVEQLENFTGDD